MTKIKEHNDLETFIKFKGAKFLKILNSRNIKVKHFGGLQYSLMKQLDNRK